MKLSDREMKILETIEKKPRIQQNDLLDIINAKANVTVLKDIEKLILQDMIFGYKIGQNRFYELEPHQAFYRNLVIQIKYRITQLMNIIKNIEKKTSKYGLAVLHNIQENFSLYNYNPRDFKNEIDCIIHDKPYDEMSAYRQKIIKNISMVKNTIKDNLFGMSNKSINDIHIECNHLCKKYIALMHDRNKMNISKERFLLDDEIKIVEHKYAILHKQFYILEKHSKIYIKNNQDINEIYDSDDLHNKNHNVIKKNIPDSNDDQYCKRCEEILEIISYHGSPIRMFITNILYNQRSSMTPNTIIKHITDLINAKRIHIFTNGKNTAYYLADDARYVNSKKQINEKIEEWYDILSMLEQKSDMYDIAIQRSILSCLNKSFGLLQEFNKNMFGEYAKHEESLRHETNIHEMFITICQKIDIEKLLKNVLDKCKQIRDILYYINKTSKHVFQSDQPIKYSDNSLIQLQNAENDLKRLCYEKIGYNDPKIQKIFEKLFINIDGMIDMLSKKSLKNIDEYYKLFRNIDELLSDIHAENTDIASIEVNLILLKTDMVKNRTTKNENYDELVERLISLFKYSCHHEFIKKLIIDCCKTS